ncbi:hypothetical protein [Mangrovicoccus sp. HB161399]|uniref:hypothetical protein n=1 Tax=Mangrovicoccus sp. HB161399 TaxID=2720392 RepID=UPI001552FBC5|nr:hypothetical protein [Mangrovicoccus sp. HB161399]
MVRGSPAALAAILTPAALAAQQLPSVDDLRGALFICSGGQVSRKSVEAQAEVNAFVSIFRRRLGASADLGGARAESEIGGVFEQTLGEDERLEAFRIYQGCLADFVAPLLTAEGGTGPGVQSQRAYRAVVHEAYHAGDLAFVTLGLSQFYGRQYLGIDPETFRGMAGSGAIYSLEDAGGLADCSGAGNPRNCGYAAGPGDTLSVILTFRRTAGTAPVADTVNFSFSGNLIHGGIPANLGIRQIPLVPLSGGDG